MATSTNQSTQNKGKLNMRMTLILYALIPLICSSLILIVLGAFLYHMIFEGKSQYIMPYYIILTGFSGAGTDLLIQKINGIRKAERVPVTVNAPAAEETENTPDSKENND